MKAQKDWNMKIDQHSVTLPTSTRVPAQTRGAQTGSTTSGQTTEAANPFAALVAGRLPLTSPGEGLAGKTSAASIATKTTAATLNPLAGLVTCAPPPPIPTSGTAPTGAGGTEVAPVNPLAGLVTVTPPVVPASTPSSTPATTPAPTGISALIAAIMNGTFQPTYSSPGYASDQTAQQLATLLGGKVVQQVPFPSSNATTTELKANFIQLPSGQTVNAADLAYYARCGGGGVQQLAADLTQEINEGGAITAYNDQMLAFLSGTGNYPGAGPIFQANVIGPPIAGMTYPPGTLAADGSVINPNAPSGIAT
jgi:hypothetical protein